MKTQRDENFKRLKAQYKAMVFVPTAGLILSIFPVKPLMIWLALSFGIDPDLPTLDQNGGTVFLVSSILTFAVIIFTGAAVGFLLIAGYLKATEGLSPRRVFRAFAKGDYPSHWLKHGQP